MKIRYIEIKPLRPIPTNVPYDRMKDFLSNHATLHYFAHLIYCPLTLRYKKIPYSKFLEHSYNMKNEHEKALPLPDVYAGPKPQLKTELWRSR